MLRDTQPSRIWSGPRMDENPRSRLSFWPKGPSICLAQVVGVVGLGTTARKEIRRANGPAVCIHQSAPSSVGAGANGRAVGPSDSVVMCTQADGLG